MKLVVALCLFTSLMAFGAEQVKNIEDIPSSGGTSGCGIPRWCWEHDKGTNGSSTGSSKMSGELRQFDAVWKYYGGERFHIYLGPDHKDGKSTSFTLDTWVYFNKLATVNNIELDLNQVTLSGNTVIYGMQCNFPKGMWQYVTNHSGHPHWNNSNVACLRKRVEARRLASRHPEISPGFCGKRNLRFRDFRYQGIQIRRRVRAQRFWPGLGNRATGG